MFVGGDHKVKCKSGKGFTLIEMAIGLAIAGTVLIGAVGAIRAQANKARVEKSQKSMQDIREALLGFVAVNGRLPCPDGDGDGDEESANCSDSNSLVVQSGTLPWRSLGVKPFDQWGSDYDYLVIEAYASSPTRFTLNTNPDSGTTDPIMVRSQDVVPVVLVEEVPALVVSHGKNTTQDYSFSGGDTFDFGGDDHVMWIPPDLVKYQAVKASWLP